MEQKALGVLQAFASNPSREMQEEAINALRVAFEIFLNLKYCLYIPNSNQTSGQIVQCLKDPSCIFVNPDKDSIVEKLNDLVDISW